MLPKYHSGGVRQVDTYEVLRPKAGDVESVADSRDLLFCNMFAYVDKHTNMCVCVCARARACVRVCVCVCTIC